MLRVGIDIGGTFTDFIAWQDDGGAGKLKSFKVPSTPPNYEDGFIAGLEQVLSAFDGVAQDDIMIMHGTTISTNTVIERSAAPIALLTTKGFRDILNIQRLRLRNPTNLFDQRAKSLVPRELVFEIDERLNYDGSVRKGLDPEQVVRAAEQAFARGAEGLAIAFYHSYRNPAHENAARDALAAAFPDLEPSLSSEIWPQIGEYERAMAAVLNAYVKPKVSRYVSAIETYLAQNLPKAHLYITRSNGGAKWRSGSAIEMEMENTGVEATFVVRGMERFHFQPWGGKGGKPGRLCEVIMNPGTAEQASIGKIKVLTLKKGDVLKIISPAGGGFGRPQDRDLALIEQDIRSELMSPEKAARDYDIVFDADGHIDTAATKTKRAGAQRDTDLFNYGPTREAYNKIWPTGMRAQLANTVLSLDKATRRHVMDRACAALTQKGEAVTAPSIRSAVNEALTYIGEKALA